VLAAVSIRIRLCDRWTASLRQTSSPWVPGQVPVQRHDVVAGGGQVIERVVPVKDHVDGHALPAQPGPDRGGQHLEVFDDQHPHGLHGAR
jgi:hypothetical protein